MTSAICPCVARSAGSAVHEDAEHARLRLEVGVAREDRLALRAEVAVHAEVGERALARPCVGLGAGALLLHECVESGAVDAEPGLLGDLEREVDREAVGVVQQERLIARERVATGILRRRQRRVEDDEPAASVRRNVSSSAYAYAESRA